MNKEDEKELAEYRRTDEVTNSSCGQVFTWFLVTSLIFGVIATSDLVLRHLFNLELIILGLNSWIICAIGGLLFCFKESIERIKKRLKNGR